MTRSIEIGAPSLTGKDANDAVTEVFGDAAFPLKVLAQNLMPRDVVFPEVPGLFLKHVANTAESRAVVEVVNLDLFHRVTSSIEQIAELNGYPHALTFTEVEGAASTDANTAAKGKKGKAPTADAGTDDARPAAGESKSGATAKE
ncbi:hypothetical protein [Burkholderia plantarii]|uniref:Uncharacterized protein n=1 Tax=Burkholderia plantarii TaxID=41899 RepID=A0A0B6RLM8_BURPL|nr:hypothetical protein [Burkholderia plantarii]AJK46232.1 hypothetical protein BGL_1c17230 [Burkholderia plantarii]